MTDILRAGIIGCGNISTAYLTLAPMFNGYAITAVADLNMDAAKAQADTFGVRAQTVDALLAADDIDLIINLTIPAAHVDVSRAILQAGKHVYSEKPFVLTLAQAQELGDLAAARGLRIGSAPDTFMGASHQLARKLIDDGSIGRVTSGTATVMSHGMEHWHPNPDFFFLKGAGPILDMGPYYVSNLVQLLGPVARVTAFTGTARDSRTIGNGPRLGEDVPVETPTTIHAVLSFHNGAIITLLASWDVWANTHPTMELYGTDGTMSLPDPNWFGGELTVTDRNATPTNQTWDQTGKQTGDQTVHHPFGVPNFEDIHANYRGAGLADMALSIAAGTPHRCSADFATHVVEVMTAILDAGENGSVKTLQTTCTRPAPTSPDDARALLA